MAEILNFPKRPIEFCDCTSFRKALAAVNILMSTNADEACALIPMWVEHGLLSEDEAAALYTFYGWE